MDNRILASVLERHYIGVLEGIVKEQKTLEQKQDKTVDDAIRLIQLDGDLRWNRTILDGVSSKVPVKLYQEVHRNKLKSYCGYCYDTVPNRPLQYCWHCGQLNVREDKE